MRRTESTHQGILFSAARTDAHVSTLLEKRRSTSDFVAGPPSGPHASETRGGQVFLMIALLAALLLRMIVAIHSPSIAHPDEIFQTQEPAHRLAYGYGVVTWEWREGIRSWIFPGLLAGIMRATGWLGSGSSGYLIGIDATLAVFSLVSVWFGYYWTKATVGTTAALIAAGGAAIWWELIYFGAKPLNEVVAASALLAGLYFGAITGTHRENRRLVFAGVCCGLAVALRVQLAPAAAFAILYFARSDWRHKSVPIVLGFLAPVVLFGLLDGLTWSYPFQSFFKYAWVNVAEGKSANFGTDPWYWYILVLTKYCGPLLLFAVIGARRSPLLAWIALIIVASHSALGHKEVRFIYPAIPLIVTLGAIGIAVALEWGTSLWKRGAPQAAVIGTGLLLIAANSAFIASRFPGWRSYSGGVVALDQLSRDATVCGLGLYGMHWYDTGGYTHLHRRIPIVVVPEGKLQEDTPAFNALLVGKGLPVDIRGGFSLDHTWTDVSLYRRPGTCTAPGGDEINAVLRRSGS